jgi:hypothetical protein
MTAVVVLFYRKKISWLITLKHKALLLQ